MHVSFYTPFPLDKVFSWPYNTIAYFISF